MVRRGVPVYPLVSCAFFFILAVAVACQSEASVSTNDDCISCHGRSDLVSIRGKSRFIDPLRVANSAHAKKGIGCVSCHEGITFISREERIPHRRGIEPKCAECHPKEAGEYDKSLHAQVSKKLCYSCHNPHYSVSFRGMSGDERKGICLKCHDATRTHLWLPQKELHFNYLECTSCHSLKAQIGMMIFMVDKTERSKEAVLTYNQLQPFLEAGKSPVETLDRDANGTISDVELFSFMKSIKEGGIPTAGLEVRILVLNPVHDFSSKGEKARDCTLCHSKDARFYSTILLEVPEKDGGFTTFPVEKGILVSRGPFMGDFYLLGESKIRPEDLEELLLVVRRIGFKWLDVLGACLAFFTLAAVCFHALLMFLTRNLRRRTANIAEFTTAPIAIRVWHWVHGLCIILLLLTGIQLRLPDVAPIFATFLNAVNLHNLSGIVLIIDFVFWLSYQLGKREFLRRYFVSPRHFFSDIAQTLHYYGYLIFVGEDFPKGIREYPVFDPLERSYFLTTMLVFLPIQMLTGLLLMDMNTTMPIIRALGGMRVVDAVHLLFAYLFASSMIVHIYFHTLKRFRGVAGH
ncbi:MAG: cytochrome b/b6 domain-containing protein [Desulfomonile sp.]|nr:cytochrome b/b6 domain-containing protein [Desulfomonile sp.]